MCGLEAWGGYLLPLALTDWHAHAAPLTAKLRVCLCMAVQSDSAQVADVLRSRLRGGEYGNDTAR